MKKSVCKTEQDAVKKQRYVAHVDMLGFKKAIEYNPDRAWEALNYLYVEQLRITGSTIPIKSQNRNIISTARTVMFSDSIIIFTEGDTEDDFFSIITQTAHLFLIALTFRGIPLRGGIARGFFYADRKTGLYMGKPLIKAYEVGEEAQWMGVVVASETLSEKDIADIKEYPYFVNWDVPCKKGSNGNSVVVNWPWLLHGLPNCQLPCSAEELYKRGFEDFFGPFEKLDNEAQTKYKNTQNFIDVQLKDLEFRR